MFLFAIFLNIMGGKLVNKSANKVPIYVLFLEIVKMASSRVLFGGL